MKKKILSLILVAVMLLSTMVVFPVAVGADGENTFDATAENPQITTAADMAAFRDAVNAGTSFDGKTVSLKADVDLGAAFGWWESIGTKEHPFIGHFDGEGHAVNIKREGAEATENGGLFGRVRAGDDENGSSVKNLKVTGSFKFSGGVTKFGSVVCMVDANNASRKGTVTIDNVWSAAFIDSSKSTSNVVGGIIGGIEGLPETGEITLNITNCLFSGYVGGPSAGQKNHGCILGWTGETQSTRYINIENCVVTGMLDIYAAGDNDNGGFVGILKSSGGGSINAPVYTTLNDLIFAGKIKPKATSAGDEGYIVGCLGNKSIIKQSDFENCYYVVRAAGGGYTVTSPLAEGQSNATKFENVTAKTLDELSAMTAGSNFTNDSEWAFGATVPGYNESLNVPVPKTIYDTFLTTKVVIKSNEEFLAFAADVNNGNKYESVTVLLDTDITIEDGYTGIGNFNLSSYFAGIFDGQGHTITINDVKVSEDNGTIFNMIVGATLRNFNVVGRMYLNDRKGYRGGIVGTAQGKCLIENVHNSIDFEATGFDTMATLGGFIGSFRKEAGADVTFEQCVFDGIINVSNYTEGVGGFVGSTHSNSKDYGKKVTFNNCVNAGKISLNDKNSKQIGGFVGFVKEAGKAVFNDCYSIGEITFRNNEFEETTMGVAVGDCGAEGSVTINNFYYVAFRNGTATGEAAVVGSDNTIVANKMTKAEIAALTAEDFSADAKLSFKTDAINDYYPCPTGLVPAEGWLASLSVIYNGARFMGAQIRCIDPADQYAGIRFVTVFDAAKVENAGNADANFGVILVSKAKYDELSDKNSVAALEAVGVKVAATQADVDGDIVTVKAVVYNITAEHYSDEIVAVAYIGDTVVDSGARSIYYVAQMCVEDAEASEQAKSFSQQIVNIVEGN